MTSRPIPESYWVIPNRFLAGEYPGHYDEGIARQKISAFIEAGFTHFINLTQPHELVPYEMILMELAAVRGIAASCKRIPVRDFSVPSRDDMRSILDSIDEALAAGGKVYLHCWGGIGRTGTAVGCYLVRHGMDGDQALDQIAEWWQGVPKRIYHPHSPQNEEQFDFIRNWKEDPHPYPSPSGRGGKGEGE